MKTFDIGKVFTNAFETIGANAGLYFGLSALFAGIPAFMMKWWMVQSGAVENPAIIFSLFTTREFVMPYLILLLVSLITDAALQGGLIDATGRRLSGRPVNLSDCLEAGFGRLLPIVAVHLIVVIGVSVAALLIIVPGVILACCWCIAVAANVEERNGIGNALDRSVELTRGARWNIFFLFLILYVAAWVIEYVIKMVGGMTGYDDGVTLTTVLEAIAQTVFRVVWITVGASLYFELRRLKEGAPRTELETVFS